MKLATRLCCTTLLAVLGIGLAQAAPILGPGKTTAPGAPAPDLEFGFCSPDPDKITGFARCDEQNDRKKERRDWVGMQPGTQLQGETGVNTVVAVPAPSTLGLLGLALLGLGYLRIRRDAAP